MKRSVHTNRFSQRRNLMSPIQMTVLAGVLLLITALNLKLVLWYIEKKQAKQALHHYNTAHPNEDSVLKPIAFSLSEIKCVDSIKKDIDTYLDALKSNELEKIAIMKDDTLVAVIIPIARYEKLIQYTSHNTQEES